jgi:hypothetical protein
LHPRDVRSRAAADRGGVMDLVFKALFDGLLALYAALLEPDEKKRIAKLKAGQKKLRKARDERMGRT